MRRSRLKVQARWLVCVALLWVCTGCAELKTSPPAASQSVEVKKVAAVEEKTTSNENLPFFHKVRWDGETLSLIAKWYTGDRRNWKALAKVNPWVEPNNMFAGLKVKIPRQLLKNQKPMPREFVFSSAFQGKAHSQTVDQDQREPFESSAERGKVKGSYMEFVVP